MIVADERLLALLLIGSLYIYFVYRILPITKATTTIISNITKQVNESQQWWQILEKNTSVYEDNSMVANLSQRIRILCWVMTHPKNHEKRCRHVKATWGKRCNVLLFMSTVEDKSLPAIKLPIDEGRNQLWGKTKRAFKYVHTHHRDDADWFLKADDDTYVVVENLRYMLSRFSSNRSIYFGCRFKNIVKQSYMSGGAGYVLSQAALNDFVLKSLPYSVKCKENDTGSEDAELARCLKNVGVEPMDSRDCFHQGRFFPFDPSQHLFPGNDSKYWYWDYIFYPIDPYGIMDCCSKHAISFHYITPDYMYTLDYLIYHKPYGIKHLAYEQPRININDTAHQITSNPKPLPGFLMEYSDRSVADELARKVRVLCWVMTHPGNHEHLKNIKATWGKRCNVLLFMTTAAKNETEQNIMTPVQEGEEDQWSKTKAAFRYVHEHHRDDADWFMKADDDTYVVVENLRYMLADHNYNIPVYFRCRFMHNKYVRQYPNLHLPSSMSDRVRTVIKKYLRMKLGSQLKYSSGGSGYVLSRAGLELLAEKGLSGTTHCRVYGHRRKDFEIDKCLTKIGVMVGNSRASLRRSLFFPFRSMDRMFPAQNQKFWYWNYFYYPTNYGLDCCSKYAISFHNIEPNDMYVLHYLIYKLRPYGVQYKEGKKTRIMEKNMRRKVKEYKTRHRAWDK